MKFYYVNHLGKKVDFSAFPYLFQEGDILDWDYTYDTKNDSEIINVRKVVKERTIKIAIVPDFSEKLNQRKESLKKAADYLLDVLQEDVNANIDGKLYTDTGYYLSCRIFGSKKTDWNIGLPVMFNEFAVISPAQFWVKEILLSYPISNGDTKSIFLDFPYDFPFDYTSLQKGISTLKNDHYADVHFKMTIYGPVVDPMVSIEGYNYEVHTTVEENEYLIIDSVQQTVTRTQKNGEVVNEFDNRSFQNSVFQKIPHGDLNVVWSGNFGWDIILYQERSEPKW